MDIHRMDLNIIHYVVIIHHYIIVQINPRTIRLSTPEHEAINKTKRSESEDSIELRYDELSNQLSDDDDPNKFITDFDPSIQPMSHLLSMPASGEVKGICMSPYNGMTKYISCHNIYI